MKVAILAAYRTPIGKFGGSLASMSAVDLGTQALQATLQKVGLHAGQVDLSITGLARQAGCGPNPGRQIGIRAGVPPSVPAYTLNQACASGLSAVMAGARHILLEEAHLVAVIGTESMSNVPYFLPKARWGQKMGHVPLVDGMYQDGLFCPLSDKIMGETVEGLAQEFGISRSEQDEFAMRSQQRAHSASFAPEYVPLTQLDHDEHARASTSLQSLAKLAPVFSREGTLTAGNSSGITDGAAVILLASPKFLEQHQVKPWAHYLGGVVVGLEPERMGLGPVPAMRAYHQKYDTSAASFDWFEINEAFAAQVLACQRELHLPEDKLNPRGGSIALGHPIGCSGARIAVTLLHGLQERGGGRGLASLCVSGGMGICAGFELC